MVHTHPPAPVRFSLGLYVDGWTCGHENQGVFLLVSPFVQNFNLTQLPSAHIKVTRDADPVS